MMPGLVSLPNEEDGAIVGEVWWVDHFGNCQLNIDPAELQALGVDVGGSVELRFGNQQRMARWVRTYADAKPSELVMLVDSYGLRLDRARPAVRGRGARPARRLGHHRRPTDPEVHR